MENLNKSIESFSKRKINEEENIIDNEKTKKIKINFENKLKIIIENFKNDEKINTFVKIITPKINIESFKFTMVNNNNKK